MDFVIPRKAFLIFLCPELRKFSYSCYMYYLGQILQSKVYLTKYAPKAFKTKFLIIIYYKFKVVYQLNHFRESHGSCVIKDDL